MSLVIGNTVKATKDIVIDKYHHGYVIFPEGSLFTFDGFEKTGLNMVFTPLERIDVEQPKSVILAEGEFTLVERDAVVYFPEMGESVNLDIVKVLKCGNKVMWDEGE